MFREVEVEGDVCVISPEGEEIVFHDHDEWPAHGIAVMRFPVDMSEMPFPLHSYTHPRAMIAGTLFEENGRIVFGAIALGGLTREKIVFACEREHKPMNEWLIVSSESVIDIDIPGD